MVLMSNLSLIIIFCLNIIVKSQNRKVIRTCCTLKLENHGIAKCSINGTPEIYSISNKNNEVLLKIPWYLTSTQNEIEFELSPVEKTELMCSGGRNDPNIYQLDIAKLSHYHPITFFPTGYLFIGSYPFIGDYFHTTQYCINGYSSSTVEIITCKKHCTPQEPCIPNCCPSDTIQTKLDEMDVKYDCTDPGSIEFRPRIFETYKEELIKNKTKEIQPWYSLNPPKKWRDTCPDKEIQILPFGETEDKSRVNQIPVHFLPAGDIKLWNNSTAEWEIFNKTDTYCIDGFWLQNEKYYTKKENRTFMMTCPITFQTRNVDVHNRTDALIKSNVFGIEFPEFKNTSKNINSTKIYTSIQYTVHDKTHYKQFQIIADEINLQLEIVSTEFNQIFIPYTETESQAKQAQSVAISCAKLNRRGNKNLLSINKGINTIGNKKFIDYQNDINYFLQLANKSNSIFPGTMAGIILNQNDIHNITDEFIRIVIEGAPQLKVLNLTFGIATKNCQDIIIELIDKFNSNISIIIKNINILICESYVNSEILNPQSVIDELGFKLITWRHRFYEINQNLQVILLSGWSTNTLHKSIENMRTFWVKLEQWSQYNKFPIIYREAFDPPSFKIIPSDLNTIITNQTTTTKDFGNYGWWKSIRKDGQLTYVVKACENVTGNEYCETKEKTINCIVNPNTCIIYVKTDKTLLIILGSVALVILLLLSVYVGYLQYGKKTWKTKSKLQGDEIIALKAGLENILKGKPLTDECKNPPNTFNKAMAMELDSNYITGFKNLKFDFHHFLGKGEFGCIYKGNVDGHEQPVAIKTIQSTTTNNYLEILSEVKVMIYIGTHSNIITLIATCVENLQNNGTLYIVFEFCSNGSLDKYLQSGVFQSKILIENSSIQIDYENTICRYYNVSSRKSKKSKKIKSVLINEKDFLHWAYEIACGMEFLASKKLVHADLATRNILVTENKIAKISDFGLSIKMSECKDYVKINARKIPWKWMAPEVLNEYKLSTESDVWAYGVTLWEIFSKGNEPYSGITWSHTFVGKLLSGERLEIPQYCQKETFELMKKCWNLDPSTRPSFTELKSYFNETQYEQV